jgi:hypothetical protein
MKINRFWFKTSGKVKSAEVALFKSLRFASTSFRLASLRLVQLFKIFASPRLASSGTKRSEAPRRFFASFRALIGNMTFAIVFLFYTHSVLCIHIDRWEFDVTTHQLRNVIYEQILLLTCYHCWRNHIVKLLLGKCWATTEMLKTLRKLNSCFCERFFHCQFSEELR